MSTSERRGAPAHAAFIAFAGSARNVDSAEAVRSVRVSADGANASIDQSATNLETAVAQALPDNGVLVITGPTENFMYRFGRKLAGFSGHYHHTTIQHINEYVDGKMTLLKRTRLPHGLALFVLSCWKRSR